jgi:hypothetical protein
MLHARFSRMRSPLKTVLPVAYLDSSNEVALIGGSIVLEFTMGTTAAGAPGPIER